MKNKGTNWYKSEIFREHHDKQNIRIAFHGIEDGIIEAINQIETDKPRTKI